MVIKNIETVSRQYLQYLLDADLTSLTTYNLDIINKYYNAKIWACNGPMNY
jgi:hypothetical protein